MLAIQTAVTQGSQSLQPLIIIASVLIVIFWRVAVRIGFTILIVGILILLTSGAVALLPMLGHVIK